MHARRSLSTVRSRGARLAIGVAMALVVVTGCGGGNDDPAAQPNPGQLFPDRANQFREDQERAIGDPVLLSGYTATVTDAAYDGDGTITVSVLIDNRDEQPQPVSATDWQVVSPDVTSYEAVSSTLPASGEVGDQPVTGTVTFRVDALDDMGDFYIVYKPDALDAARGIWQLSNP